MIAERVHRRVLLESGQAALEERQLHSLPAQQAGEMSHAVAVVDENHLLLGGIASEKPQQRDFLGARTTGSITVEQCDPASVHRVTLDQAAEGCSCSSGR